MNIFSILYNINHSYDILVIHPLHQCNLILEQYGVTLDNVALLRYRFDGQFFVGLAVDAGADGAKGSRAEDVGRDLVSGSNVAVAHFEFGRAGLSTAVEFGWRPLLLWWFTRLLLGAVLGLGTVQDEFRRVRHLSRR